MSEKIPSKADALRAMREANYSAKSSDGARNERALPSANAADDLVSVSSDDGASNCPPVTGDRYAQGKLPTLKSGSSSETKTKKKRAPAGSFDRKAYQRELMRKRRAQE
jgi:hypothetical protein